MNKIDRTTAFGKDNLRNASSPDSNSTRKLLWNIVDWPEDGYVNIQTRYIRTGKATGKPILDEKGEPKLGTSGRAFTSIDDGLSFVDCVRSQPNRVSVGVCVSSQSQCRPIKTTASGFEIRAAVCSPENVVAIKSLLLDINTGDYANNSAIVGAVLAFTGTMGFPPPSVIVPADGRLHYVWLFDRSLPLTEWQPLALAFEEAIKRHGLKCNSKSTADPTHVMPLPSGTVTMMQYPTYPVELIAGKLAPYQAPVPAPVAPSGSVAQPAHNSSDKSAALDLALER